MRASRPFIALPHPSIAFALLTILFGVLWIAGGASRNDASGQVVVRAVAWAEMALFCLFGQRRSPLPRPVLFVLLGVLAIAMLQLIPLPPEVWQGLPGRQILSEAATATGQAQPWRPLSIMPDATINAASSLIVPFTTLLLVVGLRESELRLLPTMFLIVVLLSSLIALLQFSGASLDNPFVNDTAGDVAGTLANRNHFALLVALGCLFASAWAFQSGSASDWRKAVMIGILPLFALVILASGSRAGTMVGVLGIGLGLIMARHGIGRALASYPRWVTRIAIAGALAAIGLAVLMSVVTGRAVSINRVFAVSEIADVRIRALPTIWAMTVDYFPFGSGLGSFDAAFRVHEPMELLKPTYLNHAHNDWLEFVLDTGVPGLLLLSAAAGWWIWASVHAWWIRPDKRDLTPRLGSAILLLIMIASAFDYPARTPIMMAIAVVAGIWLGKVNRRAGAATLPASEQHL